MTIVKNVASRGTVNTSTLSGNIVLDEAAGQLIIRDKTTHQVLVKLSSTGLEQFNSGGSLIVKLNEDGLQQFKSDGVTKLIVLDPSGLHQYSDGKQVVLLDASGYHQYRSDGSTELVVLDTAGLTFSETSGTRRIRIGSHPTDGHVIEAISESGVDVITELSS